MPQTWKIILWHQIVFLGMFFGHSLLVGKRTGQQVRGPYFEALLSTIFFVVFVGFALAVSLFGLPFGVVRLLNPQAAESIGIVILLGSVFLSAAALLQLKDSWRLGIVQDQKTELVTTGIYRFSRNPYYVAYMLILPAYTVLLQNVILLAMSGLGCMIVHQMVLKEEKYLSGVHGESYAQYKRKVPRYCLHGRRRKAA